MMMKLLGRPIRQNSNITTPVARETSLNSEGGVQYSGVTEFLLKFSAKQMYCGKDVELLFPIKFINFLRLDQHAHSIKLMSARIAKIMVVRVPSGEGEVG